MPDNPRNAKRHKTRPRDSAGPQLARRVEAEARARTAEELLHELRVHQIELESQNEELRRAQVALEIARDRYLDLFEFAPVGYITVNHDGLIIEANLMAAAMLGEDRKNLLQRQFVGFVGAADSDHWRRHFMSLQRETDRQRVELMLQNGTGSLFPAQLDCQPIAVSGDETAVRMALTDISALKRAEDDLRVAATAFESQEAIVITDAGLRILRVNRTFIEETGYTAEEAIGRTPPQLLRSGREPPEFYDLMDKQIARTGIWQGEVWNRRKNGEVYPAWLTVTAVKNAAGEVTHYVGAMIDISLRKAREEEINRLAYYDPLTALPNRRLMLDRLRQALSITDRSKHEGALMFIDLDHFKTLNDTAGHDKGDLLLRQVAERLLQCMRDTDTVARLGGDEFVVVLTDLSIIPGQAAAQAQTTAEKILAALSEPFDLDGHRFHGSASIGVTLFAGRQESIDELLKRADLAMYQAKEAGRNAMRFYDSNIQLALSARAALESELRLALHHGQLFLLYEPQVDRQRVVTGYEALVRWQHPQRGLILPDEFIPVAEDAGLIVRLGTWVLETACLQLVAWSALPDKAHLTLAVNVSAHQLRHPKFVEQVLAVLDFTGANPGRLMLELTESVMLGDAEDTQAKMASLKVIGVGLCLDDFGTGYSSLSNLKQLPVDQLKIDESFVRGVLTDANAAAIARSILTLGHSLDKEVIAEGVETEAQWDFLFNLGCRTFQGYLFGDTVADISRPAA